MSQIEVNKIICGDCLEVMKDWDDNFFDGIVTDPPYGLGFMGKDWDTFKEAKATRQEGYYITKAADGSPVRHQKGFSAASAAGLYDHSRNAEFQQWFTLWAAECLRTVKPGAFMLCFGGTRTYHRLTCAIEDAGWQIRDCVMWLYGSGFPKSLNIGKKVEGWEGYGTALKPAWEPIVVAMKPLDGTFAQNAEKHGVAGLNINGGRIGIDKRNYKGSGVSQQRYSDGRAGLTDGRGRDNEYTVRGRWPANVILDEEAGAVLDEQSGELKSGDLTGQPRGENKNVFSNAGSTIGNPRYFKGDKGGASRFFYCAKASRSERNAGLEGMEEKRPDERTDVGKGIWTEKGTAKQTNHHPTVKPLKLMEYLCRLLKPPTEHPILLDPFTGSGTTLMAAINTGWDYVGIEKEPDYRQIAEKRIAWAVKHRQGQQSLFRS